MFEAGMLMLVLVAVLLRGVAVQTMDVLIVLVFVAHGRLGADANMVRLGEVGRLELVVKVVGGGCILRGADGAERRGQRVRVGLMLVHGEVR